MNKSAVSFTGFHMYAITSSTSAFLFLYDPYSLIFLNFIALAKAAVLIY